MRIDALMVIECNIIPKAFKLCKFNLGSILVPFAIKVQQNFGESVFLIAELGY